MGQTPLLPHHLYEIPTLSSSQQKKNIHEKSLPAPLKKTPLAKITPQHSTFLLLTQNGSLFHCPSPFPVSSEFPKLKIQNLSPNKPVLSLSASSFHAAFTTHDGLLYTFGLGPNGQLGLGKTMLETNQPRLVTSLMHFSVSLVSCSDSHTLCYSYTRDATGAHLHHVWGTGLAYNGALGKLESSTLHEFEILRLFSNRPVMRLETDNHLSAAVLEGGKAYMWGAIPSDFRDERTIDVPVYLTGVSALDIQLSEYFHALLSQEGDLYFIAPNNCSLEYPVDFANSAKDEDIETEGGNVNDEVMVEGLGTDWGEEFLVAWEKRQAPRPPSRPSERYEASATANNANIDIGVFTKTKAGVETERTIGNGKSLMENANWINNSSTERVLGREEGVERHGGEEKRGVERGGGVRERGERESRGEERRAGEKEQSKIYVEYEVCGLFFDVPCLKVKIFDQIRSREQTYRSPLRIKKFYLEKNASRLIALTHNHQILLWNFDANVMNISQGFLSPPVLLTDSAERFAFRDFTFTEHGAFIVT